ncbi:hypothetical protein [Solibacillus daqui]|uniref:hypothetical protein n=1 Tax=Solibacillus daqui TaxID=2912187 RepID=UPI0023665EDE|nr:hypothetical protein [Solibacillus daqui]
MVKTKFANLGPEQLNELKSLEEKLGVTLLAYDHFATEEQSEEENNSNTINPS